MTMFISSSRGVGRLVVVNAEIIQVNSQLMRRGEPVGDVESPKGRAGIAAADGAIVLHRPGEKRRCLPKWPGINGFKPVKSEGNVRRRSGGDEPARSETHAEPPGTQGKTFVVRQKRNNVEKRELQINRVLLHWRCGLRLTRHYTG